MKRPLLPVVLLLMGGILCDEIAHPALPLLFGASFATLAAALFWERGRLWMLGLLILLTGWTGARRNAAILSPYDLRLLLGGEARAVSVRGAIQAAPSQHIYVRDQREFWHSSALIQADEILLDGNWRPAVGRVIAGAPGILPTNVFEGQTVEVRGVIQPPRGPLADGMFDARAFYQREGVFYQLQTYAADDWKAPRAGDGAKPPLSERFRQWARKTLALGLPGEDEPLRLTWTLLLDWRAPLTGSVEEPFLRAGTYHIFAVDGLRIGLLMGITLGWLRLLQIPRPICGALALPMLWFYAGLTGWPASAVRATIMATVIVVGWACKRPVDLLNSLFAAAVIVLLWEPSQLFQPGFQLSFAVVLCIGVILPPARGWLRKKLFAGDPLLPADLQPRWPEPLYKTAGFMVDTLAVSFAAWIGSIPLAAYYFHLFTPVSLPANCVVVPATSLALMSAMGSLLTGAWLPGLATLFNNTTWALMKLIIWFSRWAAQWPGGNCNVAAPSPGVCLFCYALVLLIATGWIFRSRYKWAVSAAMLAIALAWAVHWVPALSADRLYVLPLRNGAPAFLVDSPLPGKEFLIDCGTDDAARDFLKPFLCAHGVNRLASLCLAVARLDYFGGARTILSAFPAAGVFAAAAQERSTAWRELARDLRHTNGWRAVRDGDMVCGWSVLHPGTADQFPQADDNAIALLRQLHGHSILLLPSLGRDGQDALLRRHPDLRAEIVIAGLPARDDPLSEPLLAALHPTLIVIADTKFPATRRASAALRQRLARLPARVVYIRDNGSLTLELSPHGYTLRTADGQPAPDPPPTEPAIEPSEP
jgi:competence protein ComEC